MADTLIITASPSTKSFTHAIARTYTENATKKGKKVEILDLYKTPLSQDFLRFENIKDFPDDSARTEIQKKIADAKNLVFIFPVWWGLPPAILKNFFDQNITSGFAFRYEKGKPIPMLTGKTADVFVTADAPAIFYWIFLMPIKSIFKYFILSFCGVRMRSFSFFGNRHKKTEEQTEKYLSVVKKQAEKE